jgi:hypothetical protein
MKHHDLRRGEPGPEQSGLPRVGLLEVRRGAAQELLGQPGIGEEREVGGLEAALPPGQRKLVPGTREAARDRGVLAPQSEELGPRRHGVLEPV